MIISSSAVDFSYNLLCLLHFRCVDDARVFLFSLFYFIFRSRSCSLSAYAYVKKQTFQFSNTLQLRSLSTPFADSYYLVFLLLLLPMLLLLLCPFFLCVFVACASPQNNDYSFATKSQLSMKKICFCLFHVFFEVWDQPV